MTRPRLSSTPVDIAELNVDEDAPEATRCPDAQARLYRTVDVLARILSLLRRLHERAANPGIDEPHLHLPQRES